MSKSAISSVWPALAVFIFLASPSVQAQSKGAVVVLLESGTLDKASARTAVEILATELRKHRVQVVEGGSLGTGDVFSGKEALSKVLESSGAYKLYALSLSSLGKKIIVKVDKIGSDLEVMDTRSLAASDVEELDAVIPRVVTALINGLPIKETAKVDTVVKVESKKWEKKPGEFNMGVFALFGGGLRSNADAAYGVNLKFSYEMEHLRLDTDLGVQFDGDGFFRFIIGAQYLPWSTNWSPYIGAGLGYAAAWLADEDVEHGLAGQVTLGIELFRLYRVRMIIETGVLLPFFELEKTEYDHSSYGNTKKTYTTIGFGLIGIQW